MTLLARLHEINLGDLYNAALSATPPQEHEYRAFFMSAILLGNVFGEKWLTQKILTKKALDSINYNEEDFRSEAELMNLIQMLGEGIYNLQNTPGFANILEKLATDNVESVLAEIESARLISHRGIKFEFVNRTGQKRHDYDIRIIEGEIETFCEAKRKMNGAKFSIDSFEETISRAKKQLPLDESSIVLIKVPNEWSEHEKNLMMISQNMVNKTKRPFGVICWREEWLQNSVDGYRKFCRGFEIFNEQGRIANALILPLLPLTQIDLKWIEFGRFSKLAASF